MGEDNIWFLQPMLSRETPTFETPDGLWEIQVDYRTDEVERLRRSQFGEPDFFHVTRTERIAGVRCRRKATKHNGSCLVCGENHGGLQCPRIAAK